MQTFSDPLIPEYIPYILMCAALHMISSFGDAQYDDCAETISACCSDTLLFGECQVIFHSINDEVCSLFQIAKDV